MQDLVCSDTLSLWQEVQHMELWGQGPWALDSVEFKFNEKNRIHVKYLQKHLKKKAIFNLTIQKIITPQVCFQEKLEALVPALLWSFPGFQAFPESRNK